MHKIESHTSLKPGSNRSFGLVFACFFAIIGLWPMFANNEIRLWAILVALLFLFLALLTPSILVPLNWIWFKFGLLLGAIITPLVMAVFFLFVVFPISIGLKILNRDNTTNRINNEVESYWIKRGKQPGSMNKQY